MKALISIFLVFVPAVVAMSMDSKTPSVPTYSHGTINILLGNSNGMVLVTDSRATFSLTGGHADNLQKLFLLDKTTVCSFADFASDPSPYPQRFTMTAGGIIKDFSDSLAQSGANLTFNQKVVSLANEITNELKLLGTVYSGSSKPAERAWNGMQILVAGYDMDRTPHMAKIIVRVSGNSEIADEPTITIVNTGPDLKFYTAGYDGSAQARLVAPKAFPEMASLQVYALLKAENRTAELSLTQLEQLADDLEIDAQKTTSVVGGPIQTALLQQDGVELKHVPSLHVDARPHREIAFIYGNLNSGRGDAHHIQLPDLVILQPTIHINESCRGGGLRLDETILDGGLFEECSFFFNGKPFVRDRSTMIRGGFLILGPSIRDDDSRLATAMQQMPELTVIKHKEAMGINSRLSWFWDNNWDNGQPSR